MSVPVKRIAINVGGGYVPGLNAVITGTVLAANELGWEVLGIRDGFDGLLAPERYADGGLLRLTPRLVESLSAGGSAILGNATRTDPFRVRHVNAENMVEEVDRSGDLIARIAAEKIEAVISVVGPRALSILFRLHRQGVPRAIGVRRRRRAPSVAEVQTPPNMLDGKAFRLAAGHQREAPAIVAA